MPDENDNLAVDLLEGPAPDEVLTAPTEPTETTPPAPPAFDNDAFARSLAQHLAPLTQREPAKPPLSPEEAKKLLNVWDPDDEFIAKFGNLETQKAAIVQLRDAIIKQADTIHQLRLQELREEMSGQLKPALEFAQRQEAEQREARFDKTYAVLAKPELKDLKIAVVSGLSQAGRLTGKTEAENFKIIAESMAAVIKTQNPNFVLSGGSNPPQNNNRNALRPTSSGAGGGGGNQPAVDTSGKPKAVSLF